MTTVLLPTALPGTSSPVDYCALPHLSNSDLTCLRDEQLGGFKAIQPLAQPQIIGAVVSQLLPDRSPARLVPGQAGGGISLLESLRHDPFCGRYLRQAERNRVVLFTDPATGLACKARLDVVHTSPKRQNALILDVKTTNARTQAQFLQSCYALDYDRQAAFYLDSLRLADTGEWQTTKRFQFVFIGVNQQAPQRLFVVEATSLPGFVEYGRKKYRFWLRKWQETNGLPD